MAGCEEQPPGSIIPWDDSSWTVKNVDLTDLPLTEVCSVSPILNGLFITEQISHNSLKSTCDMLNGKIPVAG